MLVFWGLAVVLGFVVSIGRGDANHSIVPPCVIGSLSNLKGCSRQISSLNLVIVISSVGRRGGFVRIRPGVGYCRGWWCLRGCG